MKKVNILFFIIFVFGLLPFSYLLGNNTLVQEIPRTDGICGELINIIDSSSIEKLIKEGYLNSVLVNRNFAVKKIDEENKKFDFIFQPPENDNSDYNSLQGTVTF